MSTPAIETVLARLKQEFIETTVERLETLDAMVAELATGAACSEDHLASLQHHVHTVKGQAATFDFPAVTQIAQDLEDYLQDIGGMADDYARLRPFLNAIRGIIESGQDPSEAALNQMLQTLPMAARGAPHSP